MPRRKMLCIITAGLLTSGLIWFLARPSSGPEVLSIGVLCYGSWGQGPSVSVRIGITNVGQTTIEYNRLNFSSNAALYVESENGWTTRDIGPLAGLPLMPTLLSPGASTSVSLVLPENTLRWQVGYKIRTASLRDRVSSRTPAKWRVRLQPLLEKLFSGKEGPEQEVRSRVFECPRR